LRKVAPGLAVALSLIAAAPSSSADWPRYGGDDSVTNYVSAERAAALSTATIKDIGERWSVQVRGRFVASPLFADGVETGRGQENVIYGATNAGVVVALRASDGTMLWSRKVGQTVQACGSTYGISSTPVLDRGRNLLYVASGDGLLHALDLGTGQEALHWPVRVIGVPDAEYVWGGLAFFGTRVYVPVASYCDEANADGYLADGRLVAVDVVDAAITGTFDVVPGPNNMGGIWGYGGISIDQSTGLLWTTTGNSELYDPECGCIVEMAGYGESLVVLDRDLNVVASSRPEGIPYVEDNDFGAAPLLFEPDGCRPMAAANAKNGRVYAWWRDDVAGGPFWSARVGPDDLGSAFIGEPSYSSELDTLIISDARDYDDEGTIRNFNAVVAFAIGPGCTLPDRPTWTAPGIGSGPKTPPLVVDDLVFVPGGFDRNVFALDARTGATLWEVGLPGAVLAPIAFADGLVLVGDTTGSLHAFGLPRPTRGVGKIGLYAI
jgi:outer membrane protein assembly factor BamB